MVQIQRITDATRRAPPVRADSGCAGEPRPVDLSRLFPHYLRAFAVAPMGGAYHSVLFACQRPPSSGYPQDDRPRLLRTGRRRRRILRGHERVPRLFSMSKVRDAQEPRNSFTSLSSHRPASRSGLVT